MRDRGAVWDCRLWLVLLAVVAVGAVAAPPSAAGGAGGTQTAAGAPFVTLQDQPDADATVTRIELAENGSGTWTIAVRTRLESAEDADRYAAFQERFRANRSDYLADFRDRMSGVVESADEGTERQMNATAFATSTRIEEAPQRWGVVTYSFRWEGFAEAESDRLSVGDVFAGEFFIEENSVLEVAVPEGYSVQSVEPEPDERAHGVLSWEGPATFQDGHPHVVATTGGAGSSFPVGPVLAGGLVLLGVVGLALAWHRGVLGGRAESTAPASAEVGSDGADAGSDVASGLDATEADPDQVPGPVTDEDRVRRLLEERGGRAKQSQIVEELQWSKSKTSRVLSRMAEADRVEKLRIGRENVIELPEDGDSD